MICPKCGQETPDELTICPLCGGALAESDAPLTEEPEAEIFSDMPLTEAAEETSEAAPEEEAAEEPAEETEETAEEAEISAPAEAEEEPEAPAEPKKKSVLPKVLLGVLVAVLIAAVVCLSLLLKYVSSGGQLSDLTESFKEKRFHGKAVAVELMDESGSTLDEFSNAQFSYYYWGEYFYFINSYGQAFDPSIPLSEQYYQEATEDTPAVSWQDYFMDNARYSMNQTEALKRAAEAEGFAMPAEYQSTYDDTVNSMETDALNTGFVDKDGNGDVLAYIQDSYGKSATIEDFKAYLYDSYYSAAYSDLIYNGFSYTDEDISQYFDDNLDYFLSYGIEKTEQPNVNVRHILIEPQADEEGNISDEAWDAAKKTAEEIYEQWKKGEATEDSFAALANENSADPGSNTTGGLYEDVYPGEMVPEFNDWCFDARKPGDTDIVKTDYGYHILYFVSDTENYYWKTVAEGELRYDDYNLFTENLLAKYQAVLTDKVEVSTPNAVKAMSAASVG